MNPNDASENDEAIKQVFGVCRAKNPLPPGFQEAVWRRIQRAQSAVRASVWASVSQFIDSVIPRPALATTYVTVLLGVAATVGWRHAKQDTARVKVELGELYVRALDPYQAPHQ